MSDHPPDPTATGPFDPSGDESPPPDFQARLLRLVGPKGSAAASTPNPDADATTADLPVIPGYRLLRKLGSGGMGDVYEAFDERLRLRVALKVMSAKLDGEATRKRFATEAAILAQFDHPNIVRVFAAGEAGRWLYFAMRYVEQGSLSKHLIAARASAATVARLVAKIARAVQHLHEKGVWHRDLKPDNILMAGDFEPLVADFGVSKWRDGEDLSTRTGVLVGTYPYMAPEMFQKGSRDCGPAADVWALGVILYELLAGRRPFSGDNAVVMNRVLCHPPPPFADAPAPTPGTDGRLEAVALRALAKDAVLRYPSAAALADDLDRWLGGLPAAPDAPTPAAVWRNAAPPPAPAVSDTAATVTAEPATSAPAKTRRRWQGVGWLAAGVAVLAVALLALVLRKPTLNEVLEKYGEAVVVDENGRLGFDLALIDGSSGVFRTSREKYLEVSGSPSALFELGTAPPFPIRIEADVVHLWGGSRFSSGGVYGRRRAHADTESSDGNPRWKHALAFCTLDTRPLQIEPQGRVVAGGAWVTPHAKALDDWFVISPRPLDQPCPRHTPGAVEDSRRITLELHPNDFAATAPNHAARLPWERVEGGIGGILFGEGIPIPRPLLGDGYGFVVTSGTTGFRNVRVSRIAE